MNIHYNSITVKGNVPYDYFDIFEGMRQVHTGPTALPYNEITDRHPQIGEGVDLLLKSCGITKVPSYKRLSVVFSNMIVPPARFQVTPKWHGDAVGVQSLVTASALQMEAAVGTIDEDELNAITGPRFLDFLDAHKDGMTETDCKYANLLQTREGKLNLLTPSEMQELGLTIETPDFGEVVDVNTFAHRSQTNATRQAIPRVWIGVDLPF